MTLAGLVLERMSQDSGPADCEPFTGWCVDLAREVLALQAVLAQHDQASEKARRLAEAVNDFCQNEAPAEWDGGDLGYSVGGLDAMATELLAALEARR